LQPLNVRISRCQCCLRRGYRAREVSHLAFQPGLRRCAPLRSRDLALSQRRIFLLQG
jgi:hypothetical protein